jgi:hypothetical protein
MPGRVTFFEFFEPPLEAGSYRVEASQQVSGSDARNPFTQTFDANFELEVQGPRFSLPPGYVHTQFPPPGAQGEYANVLAHVMLGVQTLPWQRSALAPPERMSAQETYPWLALLTFDREDPPPTVWSGTLAELLPQALPTGTISYPNLRLEAGQSPQEPCRYIDVPVDLFQQIAPTLQELRWLAHSRRIDPEAIARKAFEAEQPPPQELSAVISNRLPAPGHETVCCLVSIEQMAAALPPSEVRANAVRLAVLASWSFASVERGESFSHAVGRLGRVPGTLQVPYAAGHGQTVQAVQDALRMGYGAIDHHTRQGARTVSWYRGPLLPYESPLVAEVPFHSADALVRYDPESGMFDVALAVAWQLGRLLAVSDKGFAMLLYAWKQGRLANAVVEFERKVLGERLGVDPELLGERGVPVHATLMRNVVRPLLGSMFERGAG